MMPAFMLPLGSIHPAAMRSDASMASATPIGVETMIGNFAIPAVSLRSTAGYRL